MADATLQIIIAARDAASGVISQVEGKSSSLGSTMGTVVKAGALAGAGAVAAFGVKSILAAADFEYAVDQVGAVANATEEQMQGLSDKALQIGKDTMFGATEAAGAMEILAANGVSATDIMEGAADAAIALAAAGGTDLAMAADVASTSMAVWGIETKDMTDVVNRLAGAANVSRFGVEDMALAVAQGGGAAKTAGVEFGDFTTAIAAIAPSFSSGSDAGTSFKTFLVGLGGTSDKATDMMKDLGLITAEAGNRFFDAQGNLKSMAAVTQILHDATANLTEQQRIEALQTIFGTDAMRAAAAMAQLTGAEFQTMDETMRTTDASVVAAQRMENFKGSIEQLMGSVETLSIELGMQVIPALTVAANWLAVELPRAVDTAEPYIEGFGVGLETVFNIVEPGLELLSEHTDLVIGVAGAWAALKAISIAQAFLSAAAAIASSSLEMGFAAQRAALLHGAMLGVVGVLAALVVPPAIAGIKEAFFGANHEAENFDKTVGLMRSTIAALGGEVNDFTLKKIEQEIYKFVRENAPAFAFSTGEMNASLAGMVQGAIDSGATLEEAMILVKRSGMENIPQVTEVLDNMRSEINLDIKAGRDLQHEEDMAFKAMRASAEENIPPAGVQMEEFRKKTITNLDQIWPKLEELRTKNHEAFEDVAKSVESLAPTLDMEVDKWLEDIRRATAVYTEYEANIDTVLDAIEQQYPEHFETVGQIMLEKSPEEIAAWAQLATNNSAAFGEGIAGIGTLTSGEIDRVKTKIEARFGEINSTFTILGENARQGFMSSLYSIPGETKALFGDGIPAAAKAGLDSRSPSRVFMRIGEDTRKGFEMGMGAGEIADFVRGEAVAAVKAAEELLQEATAGKAFIANLENALEIGTVTIENAAAIAAQAIVSQFSDPSLQKQLHQEALDLIDSFATAMQEAADGAAPVVMPTPIMPPAAPPSVGGAPGSTGGGSRIADEQASVLMAYAQNLIDSGTNLRFKSGGRWTPMELLARWMLSHPGARPPDSLLVNAASNTGYGSTLPVFDVPAAPPAPLPPPMSFDQGGWLMPGVTLALNNTGRPEPVGAVAGGGITVQVNINALDGAGVLSAMPQIEEELRSRLERVMS